MSYLVYSGRTVPSKVKGELPNIIEEYISDDSNINYHYVFTRNINDAYIFFEFEEAKSVADLLGMKVKNLK